MARLAAGPAAREAEVSLLIGPLRPIHLEALSARFLSLVGHFDEVMPNRPQIPGLGILFAFGFDTGTEINLTGLSAAEASKGSPHANGVPEGRAPWLAEMIDILALTGRNHALASASAEALA